MVKRLMLFALFLLASSLLAACASPQDGRPPLQATLSVLETKAARLGETPDPKPSPTGTFSIVPLTGTGETQGALASTPLPVQEPTFTPAVPELGGSPTSDPLIAQPSPTLDCPTHEAKITLSASKTTLKVGEAIQVNVLLENTGCVTLGLPQYRLAILNSEGKPIFSPDKPDPVIHSLGVTPGKSDAITYLLEAVSPGKATLSALASFEVHLGYPGPAYWGAGSSKELVIVVEP